MPLDKTMLGTRYTCFSCGTKFYDLNRPTPTCPECSADQNDAPVQDLKALLSRNRKNTPISDDPLLDGPDDDDDDGLFDNTDDDDDDDGGGDDDDDDEGGGGDDDE
ncbi:MAG: FYDLN acid domain-containing protein [Myxococcales bacterium]|nr:FYDLN acid domain-containing protein [Myxococcales bacterium]MCB9693034.1 FYDLN acid domain-containing protein [Alphaproteobacteria bacterium]